MRSLWKFSVLKTLLWCNAIYSHCRTAAEHKNLRFGLIVFYLFIHLKVTCNLKTEVQHRNFSWCIQWSKTPVWLTARNTGLFLTYLEYLYCKSQLSIDISNDIRSQKPDNCMFVKTFYHPVLSTKFPYHISTDRWPLETIFYWLYSIKY